MVHGEPDYAFMLIKYYIILACAIATYLTRFGPKLSRLERVLHFRSILFEPDAISEKIPRAWTYASPFKNTRPADKTVIHLAGAMCGGN